MARFGQLALRIAWAATLLAVGAVQLAQGWTGGSAVPLLVAAAVVPAVAVAAGSRLITAPIVAGGVLALAAVAFWFASVRSGLDPVDTLRTGVPRLLAADRPAPPEPGLLLPAALFVALTGVLVGLRTVGGGLVAPPAAAVALYTAAALMGAGRTDPRGYTAATLVCLAVLGWAGLRATSGKLPTQPRRESALSRKLPAVVAVVATTAVALVVGPIAMAEAFDPRRLVEPEGRRLDEPSPLPRIGAWQRMGDTELLRYNAASDVRLRLVALTRYTGAGWTAEAKYRQIGADADPRSRGAQVAVTIRALDGPWLPSPARPLAVSLTAGGPAEVEIDSDSGSLALRDGVLGPGLGYRVVAAPQRAVETEIAQAEVPSDGEMQPYLQLPSVPEGFSGYAATITDGAKTAYEKAVSLEYSIRQGRRQDPGAPSGSSFARLETFLFAEQASAPGAGTGTAEQFASAFAVLARAVGLPTRIVVGFAPGVPGADGGGKVVRGRDAHAWPEVYFSGIGWYPFDPTPTAADTGTSQLKQQVIRRLFPEAVIAPPSSPAPTPSAQPAPARDVLGAEPSRPGASPGYPLMLVGTTVALLGLLLLARRMRSRRHRREGAPGAWAELLDMTLLIGRTPAVSLPAPVIAAELAGFAPARGDLHPAQVIAEAADRARFAPKGANGGDAAWRAVRLLRRALRQEIPWRRRIFWYLDPRPLWRRRRT
ncbi:MAG TPA: transglutaminaseTgpA domain-containing protein [Candidatus Limnocylindrales bacterium]